ncbi:hypothetical protein CBR_g48037 [Chara braunii]|uniref:Uncharacterized protein n=1 Tax=Chara braunii TaxID=69332 RepID=A0A388M1V9_CHABU|nr:hypothetical protein CBR_g48037 [Chara braunii]|eukprot:GBG88568.1 hypothetical protein CBR_g48037 [Chara braunii]
MSVVHSSTHAGGAAPLSSPHSHTLSSSVGGGGGGKGEPPSVLQSQVHGERGGGKEGGERGTPAAAGCTHGGGGSGGGRGGEERGGTDGMVVGMGSSGDGALRLARGNAAGEGGEVVRVMAAAGVGESGGGGVVGGAGSRLGGGGMVAVEGGTEIHAAVVTPLKEKKGKKRKGSGGGEGEGAADEDGSDGSDDESDEAVTGQKKKKWTEAEIHHLVIVRCGMQLFGNAMELAGELQHDRDLFYTEDGVSYAEDGELDDEDAVSYYDNLCAGCVYWEVDSQRGREGDVRDSYEYEGRDGEWWVNLMALSSQIGAGNTDVDGVTRLRQRHGDQAGEWEVAQGFMEEVVVVVEERQGMGEIGEKGWKVDNNNNNNNNDGELGLGEIGDEGEKGNNDNNNDGELGLGKIGDEGEKGDGHEGRAGERW